MAAIFILAGGLFGFASAIASLILLDASFVTALAIWSTSGLVVVALGLALSMLVRPASEPKTKPVGQGARTV